MKHVIIGGGIAGTSCAARLMQLCPHDTCLLITPDTQVQHVGGVISLSSRVEDIQVQATDAEDLAAVYGYQVQCGDVVQIHSSIKEVELSDGSRLPYDRLCVCTGARPKTLLDSSLIHHIRDHQSVQDLASKLAAARRVMVVGNGGIALELVSALPDKDVIWAMKHEHVGDAFFDIDAASFLLTAVHEARDKLGNPNLPNAASGNFLEASGSFLAPTMSLDSIGGGTASAIMLDGTNVTAAAGLALPSLLVNVSGSATASGISQQSMLACLERNSASSAWECSSPSIVMCTGRRANGYFGHAVGPTWTDALAGTSPPSCQGSVEAETSGDLQLEYGTRVTSVGDGFTADAAVILYKATCQQLADAVHKLLRWFCSFQEAAPGVAQLLGHESTSYPIRVCLDNGHSYNVDMVVAAIGVQPNTELLPAEVTLAGDGGVLVDRTMCSSVPHLYAAGDCCTVGFAAECSTWFQMRLWSQARTMGLYAAHCMAGKADALMCGFNFELFTHVTRFMGKKVVLLGLYNGQRLDGQKDSDIVTYARATEGPCSTFIRVLLLRGRMQGAILIGDTGLEETFEQLILDQLDLSSFGPGLLDPALDLKHLFD